MYSETYSKTYSKTYSETYSEAFSRTGSESYDGHDVPAPRAPAWLLAGEDDENDSDHPHICRGID
ncbi:hypothetical protein OG331_30035 [Streptomyces sp. NBC_01017]|uniref:hypothetical protein n=1 Tax=Streptomyces sp. NBC_01017 TaxID=2903721 RepID=UPI00386FDBF8|nr:hypothetical protein OG331_30035 [Streptomyces sp. NBC_01017]